MQEVEEDEGKRMLISLREAITAARKSEKRGQREKKTTK